MQMTMRNGITQEKFHDQTGLLDRRLYGGVLLLGDHSSDPQEYNRPVHRFPQPDQPWHARVRPAALLRGGKKL